MGIDPGRRGSGRHVGSAPSFRRSSRMPSTPRHIHCERRGRYSRRSRRSGSPLKRTRRTIVEEAEAPYPDAGFLPEPPIVAGPVPQQGWVQAAPRRFGQAVQQPPLAAGYRPSCRRARAPELPGSEGPCSYRPRTDTSGDWCRFR